MTHRLEWLERYGTHRMRIRGVGNLEVSWDSDAKGYRVYVFGNTLKQRYSDSDEAKKVAVRYALLVLIPALEQLQSEQKAAGP